jgi:glycosyltransferase involved in cell wall biosynthesis
VADKSACTKVVCQSGTVRQVLVAQRERLRLDPARVEVIHNGVDLARFDPASIDRAAARASLGLPRDAFVVGSVARLAPEKNLGLLLRGFAAASRMSREVAVHGRLVLSGPDGGCRAELEQEAKDAGVADRVLFTGLVTDTERVFGAMDVFGLTSYTEGTPAALLEAMAMARPIVATPVGGVLEMVDGNAILVDVISPRQTAVAIVELARDAALRRHLGTRSRELATGWSIEATVSRYEQVLEEAWQEASAVAA